MIDWHRVTELRSEIGAEEFREVAEMFLEETDEVIAALRDSPTPPDLRKQLHFLKGSALNLGFCEMAGLCSQGERLASVGEGEKVDLPTLISLYDKSRAAFVARLKSMPAI